VEEKKRFVIKSIRREMGKGPEFYTIKEAARILKVDYFTVYRLIRYCELDAVKVAGVWRIPASALTEYLEKNHPLNQDS